MPDFLVENKPRSENPFIVLFGIALTLIGIVFVISGVVAAAAGGETGAMVGGAFIFCLGALCCAFGHRAILAEMTQDNDFVRQDGDEITYRDFPHLDNGFYSRRGRFNRSDIIDVSVEKKNTCVSTFTDNACGGYSCVVVKAKWGSSNRVFIMGSRMSAVNCKKVQGYLQADRATESVQAAVSNAKNAIRGAFGFGKKSSPKDQLPANSGPNYGADSSVPAPSAGPPAPSSHYSVQPSAPTAQQTPSYGPPPSYNNATLKPSPQPATLPPPSGSTGGYAAATY